MHRLFWTHFKDLELKEISSFSEDVIHGTTAEAWEIIKNDGIRLVNKIFVFPKISLFEQN